jgi:putative glutamine amidotransferase
VRPLIGITVNEEPGEKDRKQPTPFPFDFIKRQYYELVEISGGLPVLLPCLEDHRLAKDLLRDLDGLLLTGGIDLDPKCYRQRKIDNTGRVGRYRDRLEIEMVGRAIETEVPIFTICRGLQLLNVALGGNLHQDLSKCPYQTIPHYERGRVDYRLYHQVRIERDSLLERILREESLKVNTSHHQVVNRLGRNLRVVARAPDGVIEGLELVGGGFVLGVQWHPEAMPRSGSTRRLFQAFVDAAREHARCRRKGSF